MQHNIRRGLLKTHWRESWFHPTKYPHTTDRKVCNAKPHPRGELLRKLSGIAHIKSELIRIDGLYGRRPAVQRHFTERKITERRRKGLIVAAAYLPIARQVGKEYVVDNLAEPRSIGKERPPVLYPKAYFDAFQN